MINILDRARLAISALVMTSLLFGIGGAAVAYQAVAATAYTATGAVNVRTGPGTSYAIVATLKSGQAVTGAGTAKNGWQPVTYGDKTRYVYASYLKATSTATPTPSATTGTGTTRVTSENVNVRTGPSLNDPIVTVLTKGTTVSSTGKTSGDFTQITHEAKLRWVYSAYLTASATTTPATEAKYSAITTALLALRTTASITATSGGDLPTGTTVELTGVHSLSYSQVLRNGKLYWVLSGSARW
ncbi:MAG: SH3 domain-containing protein [Micropruina sp.]|nr:SH3 domain-containing protein [Micropruina sp.]